MNDYKKQMSKIKNDERKKRELVQVMLKENPKEKHQRLGRLFWVAIPFCALLIFIPLLSALLRPESGKQGSQSDSIDSLTIDDPQIITNYTAAQAAAIVGNYSYQNVNYTLEKKDDDGVSKSIINKDQAAVARLTQFGGEIETNNDFYYKDGIYYSYNFTFKEIEQQSMSFSAMLQQQEIDLLPAQYSTILNNSAVRYVEGGLCEDNSYIFYYHLDSTSPVLFKTQFTPARNLKTLKAEYPLQSSKSMNIEIETLEVEVPEEEIEWELGEAFCYNQVFNSYSLCRGPSYKYQGKYVIPSIYNGKPVNRIEDSAFSRSFGITAFEIDGEINNFSVVDDVLFHNQMLIAYPAAHARDTYQVPNNITEIGSAAFRGAKNLEEIDINRSSVVFGSAFEYCSNLNKFLIDDSNTYHSVHDDVLFDFDFTRIIRYPTGNPATSYQIPLSVTGSTYSSFSTSMNLEEVIFHDAFTFYDSIFENCKNIKNVTLPTGIWLISDSAFKGSGLTSITIPDNIEYISEGAFRNCPDLEEVIFSPTSNLEVLFDFAFYNCPKLTAFEVPNTVTALGDGVFKKCINLATVTFAPNSVLTYIYYELFAECVSLKSIIFPASIRQVFHNAFDGSGIELETAENSVVYAGGWAIKYKGNINELVHLDIMWEMVGIAYRAFQGAENLLSVRLPYSLLYIDAEAFKDCPQLSQISIPPSVLSIGSLAFNTPGLVVTILGTITWPDNWKSNDVTIAYSEDL